MEENGFQLPNFENHISKPSALQNSEENIKNEDSEIGNYYKQINANEKNKQHGSRTIGQENKIELENNDPSASDFEKDASATDFDDVEKPNDFENDASAINFEDGENANDFEKDQSANDFDDVEKPNDFENYASTINFDDDEKANDFKKDPKDLKKDQSAIDFENYDLETTTKNIEIPEDDIIQYSPKITSAHHEIVSTPSNKFDNETAIVIDLGSGTIKSGFSGENSPGNITPSIVGKPRFLHNIMLQGQFSPQYYVGKEAQSKRGILSCKYPIAHGIIVDWELMELLWNNVFDQELRIEPTSRRILLTDPPLNPKSNREKIVEYMFEKYNLDATYLANSAVLSLYATGLTTGVVVSSGDGVTHTVPIYDGYPIPHCVVRSNLGGRDVTKYMVKLLTESGVYLNTSAELEIVRDLKEKCCFIASDLHKITMKSIVNDDNMDYELPDGKVLHLKSQRYMCPEVIFNPSLIGVEDPGLAQMVNLTVQKCGIDLRRSLYDRVVLAGGNTLFPNFERRLKVEIEKDSAIKVKANIVAEPDRLFSAWIGASILSTVSTFQNMWINKSEYEEEGVRIVHKKCF